MFQIKRADAVYAGANNAGGSSWTGETTGLSAAPASAGEESTVGVKGDEAEKVKPKLPRLKPYPNTST